MPSAKPTQVIVHRIELQNTERSLLKEYVEIQQNQKWVEVGSKAVGPVLIATGIVGASYVGIRGYQALQAALNDFDPGQALKELMEPVPIIGPSGPIFGPGGLFPFFDDFFTSAEDNPLYDPLVDSEGNPITADELYEANKKMQKERGILNTIVAPFGISPFPKWL